MKFVNFIDKLLDLLAKWLGIGFIVDEEPAKPQNTLETPMKQPPETPKVPEQPKVPSTPKNPTVRQFCEAIKIHEGWFKCSRSQRNHNPGNIRCGIMNAQAVGKDKDNFCIFPTDEIGFEALMHMIRRARDGASKVYSPTDTIAVFFSKYAPKSDKNNPDAYARAIAGRLSVGVDFQIKNLT